MGTAYGRWTAKKDQWRGVTDVVHTFADSEEAAQGLCADLGEAIGEKLTTDQLALLEEFLRSFAQSVKAKRR